MLWESVRAPMPEPRLSEKRRKEVAENASGICEYCRSQQSLCPDTFHVEHILPEARGGTDAAENLALSCGGCNGHKSIKTNALDPVNHVRAPLFHPRRQQWQEHFEWSSDFTLILGLTETGRATIEALRMNRIGVVNLRRVLYASGLHPPAAQRD